MGERRTKICRPLLFLPAGMISTRPLDSLYSNVPANGAPEAKRFLWRPQLSPVLSLTAGGGTQPDSRSQAASSATRWRRRTAFSRLATPRSGLPPSRLRCPDRSMSLGTPQASVGSLQPSFRGPSFLLSLLRGLPRPDYTPCWAWPGGVRGEAEAELRGSAAQGELRPPSRKVCKWWQQGTHRWGGRRGCVTLGGSLMRVSLFPPLLSGA